MFIGYRDQNILIVSEKLINSDNLSILDVGNISISTDDLLNNYYVRDNKLIHRSAKSDPATSKVALIGVFNIACGISTYAETIFPGIGAKFKEFKIFTEYNESPETPEIVKCWKRGESLSKLIEEVHKFKPDIILIQHEYGIFPKASHWLSLLSNLQKYKVFVMLHSVYKHKDKTICEAAIPNILVHTTTARQVLVDKGVTSNITVIPHFTEPSVPGKYWNLYQTPHTLIQFGFGFKYKGWEHSLKIIRELKPTFSDVFFTGLFSESPHSKGFHDKYYQELQLLIDQYGIRDNVALIRGFQTDKVLDSYLRTNKLAIFPYIDNGEHTVWGCSGAARLTMKHNIPVLVSNNPLFDDLSGICPKLESTEDFVKAITTLFNDESAINNQLKKQERFLSENRSQMIIQKYIEALTSNSTLPSQL